MLMIIKNGHIIDPGNVDGIGDVIIKDGRISEIREHGSGGAAAGDGSEYDRVIDASGRVVCPGLIDMHVHLREPGHEYKETIASGCLAAAHGGFTAVCPMPNTRPANDNRQVTEYIIKKAAAADTARVYPVGAISRELRGDGLNEYGDMKDAGIVAVSDDGMPVSDSQLMRRAMEYARGFGLPVISHCEDLSLAGGGVMNEGTAATRMGLSGIPNAAESVMVLRDIALCELTGAPLHIAHVSAGESVNAIREAKKNGLPVTAETAPHYFTLTDEDLKNYDTNTKMNPPLRSSEDRGAVRQGLADNTIDVIASDHAPHTSLEKDVEFDMAACGIIGLETSLPLTLKLVEDGVITMAGLVEKLSANPARIIGIERSLRPGAPADITIIDPGLPYTVDAGQFRSLSRNTPFDRWEMTGRAVVTVVEGRVVFERDSKNG